MAYGLEIAVRTCPRGQTPNVLDQQGTLNRGTGGIIRLRENQKNLTGGKAGLRKVALLFLCRDELFWNRKRNHRPCLDVKRVAGELVRALVAVVGQVS